VRLYAAGSVRRGARASRPLILTTVEDWGGQNRRVRWVKKVRSPIKR
jgi:hypothetical protein